MEKLIFDFGIADFEFKNSLIDFIVKNFKIKSIKYDTLDSKMGVVLKNGENIKEKIFSNADFYLPNNEIIAIQNINNSLPRIYSYELTTQTTSILIDFICLSYPQGIVYGNVELTIDRLHNTDEVKYWKVFERAIPSYVEILPNPFYKEGAPGMDMIEKEYINLESLPGHSHQMGHNDKLWFGASWQMYFSPIYYKYIPKPLWDDFTDCYEHKVFENGLRRITLFENPEDYDLSESRAKQWAFRRQLGIDSIAHEVCPRLNRQQFEPENLPVVITKKNCQKGQTRVTRFLDANKKLINSDKAVFKEVKEYLDDGITIVFEEITEFKKGFFRNLFARE